MRHDIEQAAEARLDELHREAKKARLAAEVPPRPRTGWAARLLTGLAGTWRTGAVAAPLSRVIAREEGGGR